MNYVYRYIDLADNIIKYIGIVCRDNADSDSLERRFKEHSNSDWWTMGKTWRVEYIEVPTRNDAHALEGHFIAKYNTGEWYNFSKTHLGLLSFLNTNFEWKVLLDNVYVKTKDIKGYKEDLVVINVEKFGYLVAEKLAEVRHCLKVVNSFLGTEDYSRFDRKTLLEDKKELEYREEVFTNFQLGAKLRLC